MQCCNHSSLWYQVNCTPADPFNPEFTKNEMDTSERAKHLTSNPTVVPDTLPPQSATSSRRKIRSVIWNHFTPEPGLVKKAQCNYRGCLIKYTDGTNSMSSHLPRCKANPSTEANKRRRTVTSPSIETSGVASSTSILKFDQEASRRALGEMLVLKEHLWRCLCSKSCRSVV